MSTDPQSPAISAIDAPLLAKDAEIAALKERLAALSTAAKTLRERYERLRNSPSEASDGEESDQELRERALTLAARLERKGRENLRQKGELLAARGEAEELGTRLAQSEAARLAAEAERTRLLARETADNAERQARSDDAERKHSRERAAFMAESESLNAALADKDARLAGLASEQERARARLYELEVEQAAWRQNSEQMAGELERSRAECGRLLLLRDELAGRLDSAQSGRREAELLERIQTLSEERRGFEAALKENQEQLARERLAALHLAQSQGREAAFLQSLERRDHAFGALSRSMALLIAEGADLAADCAAAREELADRRLAADERERIGARIAGRLHLTARPASID